VTAHGMPVSEKTRDQMQNYYDGVDVHDSLLAYLRRYLAQPALGYASPPFPIVGATESWIFAFQLDDAPAPWSGPLILRVDRVHGGTLVKLETSVQNVLHEQGYPTVGCTHCTKTVPGSTLGDYSRVGRWSDSEKTECGLHGGEGI
jgi:hypothetical protein